MTFFSIQPSIRLEVGVVWNPPVVPYLGGEIDPGTQLFTPTPHSIFFLRRPSCP
jgi:hypothetical protein